MCEYLGACVYDFWSKYWNMVSRVIILTVQQWSHPNILCFRLCNMYQKFHSQLESWTAASSSATTLLPLFLYQARATITSFIASWTHTTATSYQCLMGAICLSGACNSYLLFLHRERVQQLSSYLVSGARATAISTFTLLARATAISPLIVSGARATAISHSLSLWRVQQPTPPLPTIHTTYAAGTPQTLPPHHRCGAGRWRGRGEHHGHHRPDETEYREVRIGWFCLTLTKFQYVVTHPKKFYWQAWHVGCSSQRTRKQKFPLFCFPGRNTSMSHLLVKHICVSYDILKFHERQTKSASMYLSTLNLVRRVVWWCPWCYQ